MSITRSVDAMKRLVLPVVGFTDDDVDEDLFAVEAVAR
jgi:hypothetical protein